MACGLLNNVLPLPVRMGERFLNNLCTVISGAAAMGVCVFDANGDRVTEAERSADLVRAKLSYDDRAVPHVELHPMRVDP
jgi:hypothetical protein